MTASWSGSELQVTSTIEATIQIDVRVMHGADDVTIAHGPFHIGPTSPVVLAPDWPDLSEKGDLLLAPGAVAGFVRQLDDEGGSVRGYRIPRRLAFLDAVDQTYDPSELSAILGLTGALDSEGEILADASPEAILGLMVGAGVTP